MVYFYLQCFHGVALSRRVSLASQFVSSPGLVTVPPDHLSSLSEGSSAFPTLSDTPNNPLNHTNTDNKHNHDENKLTHTSNRTNTVMQRSPQGHQQTSSSLTANYASRRPQISSLGGGADDADSTPFPSPSDGCPCLTFFPHIIL